MTNEQNTVREWMKAYGQETPENPVVPSLEVRKLRAKLILEEALETIEALGFLIEDQRSDVGVIYPDSPIELKVHTYKLDLATIADGCEDLKVVTEGTLVACGLVDRRINENAYDASHGGGHYKQESSKDPLFEAVMKSNDSKLWTGKEKEAHDITKLWLEFIPTDELCDTYVAKDASGKVIKSPSYTPPNLQPIIDAYAER